MSEDREWKQKGATFYRYRREAGRLAPLPLSIILSLCATAVVFAFVLDEVKARVFLALGMR